MKLNGRIPGAVVCLMVLFSCATLEKTTLEVPGTLGDFYTFSAVQISDWHVGSRVPGDHGAASWVKNYQPELLFFTGDILDDEGALDAFDKALNHWDFVPVKLAILGNNEVNFPGGIEAIKEVYRRHGVTVLENEACQIPWGRQWIRVIGLGSLSSPKMGIPKMPSNWPKPIFTFVLIHEPLIFTQILEGRLGKNSLVLSGHTHGGQIGVLGIPLMLPSGSGTFVQGLYRFKDESLFVNRGLGNNPRLDMRLGADPQVLLIKVRPGPALP